MANNVGGGEKSPTKAKDRPHGHVTVTSGVFEIPLNEDGTVSLSNIRAQLPGASGLWFLTDDGQRKRAVSYVRKKNKLTPPDGSWAGRTYNVSYSAVPEFFGEKELERFEIASRLFQQSLESASRLSRLELDQEEPVKQKVLPIESKEPSHTEKPTKISRQLINTVPLEADKKSARKLSLSDGQFSDKKETGDSSTHDFCKSALSKANEARRQLETELASKNARIIELEKKCSSQESLYKDKCNDVEELRKSLENKSKEFDLVAVPLEGFGDSHILEELNSLKRQLDDSKWRCGELEAALTSKTREASALHDWKLEAENTINLLQTEHGPCQNRREKLEATVHALHQFALIMKKEAELAKERTGIEPQFKLYLAEDIKFISDQAEEKVRRLEKDLDVAHDNLYRQSAEVENFKWRCREFEEKLMARDKELKATIKEAFNKEKMLKSEIDSLLKLIPDDQDGEFKRVSDHHRELLTKMTSPYAAAADSDAVEANNIKSVVDESRDEFDSTKNVDDEDQQEQQQLPQRPTPALPPLKSALRRSSSVRTGSEVDLASSGVPSTPTSIDDLSLVIKDVDALMDARASKDRQKFGPSSLSTTSFTRQVSDNNDETTSDEAAAVREHSPATKEPAAAHRTKTPAKDNDEDDDDDGVRIDF